jgi:hypothetical protein
MPLDPRYITTNTLEPVFLDKKTAAPLAGGIVTFFKDNNRVFPKLVYELTGAPPYSGPAPNFTPLPNPIILSSKGTIQDAAGNNVALYYFPYDANGDQELYYVTVTDQFGVEQFTREAWPFIANPASSVSGQASINNELTNPQFSQVLFDDTTGLVLAIPGAINVTFEIAPGWSINVVTSGAATVNIARNPIAGVTAYPHNPPYTLTVTPGANIVSLSLFQRLLGNPDIWSPAVGATNGWIAGTILLAPNSNLTMSYRTSAGVPISQDILVANNLTASYAEFSNTIQLAPAANPNLPPSGYVDIVLTLPTNIPTTFSNIQVVGLERNISNIVYDETTINRQMDQMFNYYFPFLKQKPIPSYLIGWDFNLNPAQALGETVAASAAGANTSRYVWDQTIVFQSANLGPAISRAPSGSIRITATNTTQFALIQYLGQNDARKILAERFAMNIAAKTSVLAGVLSTVEVYYTTGAVLPSCGANNSIVATLDATGKPATFNLASGQPWSIVPRSGFGDARFTVLPAAAQHHNDYNLNAWNATQLPDISNATYLAVIVGFAQLPAGETIDIDSISLMQGDIATRPAPTNGGETLRRCQRFYEKSFNQGIVPASNAGLNSGAYNFPSTIAGVVFTISGFIPFKVTKFDATPSIVTFTPVGAGFQMYNVTIALAMTNTLFDRVGDNGFTVHYNGSAGTNFGNIMAINWTADDRLGR